MITRSTIVTAAVAAAAALAATGITYASAATSEPASAAAAAVQQAAPASALGGGDVGKGNEGGKGNERGGHDEGGRGHDEGGRGHYEGRIHINERTYADNLGGCVTVVSGLGSRTLNIRNDSRRTIEVFRGVTCDNGAPIATVGPHSTSNGVRPGHVHGGVRVENGVVGSFRVIEHNYDDDRGDRNW
ncbi:hypothetical protein [Streptomyces sp. NBC_00893]|uniref:hypothetical protein n=1 Tax=Streptomyces sp. NBC_00893 TaxID=2975862 RepID=UPI0022568720|nr:hypothetical protein [Streptomyces sp. NBC_00893]MCX4844027.1 hypothetical protein [Streptomyces sp. NBC_00893]